jgi:hypothetical protein
MRVECVQAVQAAIGRDLTPAEAKGIEDRIIETQRRLAAKDPAAWRGLTREQRLREAAQAVQRDIEQAAALKEERAALQLEVVARHLPEVDKAGANGFKVIQKKLEQIDRDVLGIKQQYMTEALDAIDYATRQDTGSLVARGVRWISNLQNPEKARAFIKEVFGEDTGDAGAKAAAKAWIQTAEAMRKRFNAAGGDIRKLLYGYLPQPHDAAVIRQAGIETWVKDALPLLDRKRYYNPNGTPMTDTELVKVLEEVWRNLSTEGLHSLEPGSFRGEGPLANAGSQARVLHFADADSYIAYLSKYGAGTVFDAMSGHVGWMARNIGLVEGFGPNPSQTFRTLHDSARRSGGTDRVALLMNTQDEWSTLRGDFDVAQSANVARINQGIRNLNVAGKLQAAMLSAVTDVPIYATTLGYHRLPVFEGMTNLIRSFGSDAKHFADVGGMIAESKVGELHQWADGKMGAGVTRMLANATMKASLLQAWTDAVRRAFSITMQAGMARLTKTDWEALHPQDRARLGAAGFDAEQWAILRRAQPDQFKGKDMLTPAAIKRIEGVDELTKDRLISRYLGMVTDESFYASPNPDLRTRTLQKGARQSGTGIGELWRHVMLFKGFPTAMMTRHLNRLLTADMDAASRVRYGSTLIFGTTLFGALAIQLSNLANGRDPYDMTGEGGDDPAKLAKFWGAAMAKGGGLGFIGDMLLTNTGQSGQSGKSQAVSAIAGPVLGTGFDLLYDVGIQNIKEAAQGKDTHAAAEAWRVIRGYTPAINLWYGRLALDQAVLNQFQETLSPGYLDKVKARQIKEWDASWWWEPTGQGVAADGGMRGPDRAPDAAAAVGRR